MAETGKQKAEKADAAIQTVEEYARNEIWPQVEKYVVAGDRERLAQDGPAAEAEIRATYERAQEAEVLDRAVDILSRQAEGCPTDPDTLEVIEDCPREALSEDEPQPEAACWKCWREAALAEARVQAKEGEDPG